MHSSRMRTARSLTVSPYLVVSHAPPPGATTHAPPPEAAMHTPQEQPCMPPRATMHTPLPRATTHAPQSNHACPHPWEQPCPPPKQPHMPPLGQPYTPPQATTHAPPVNRMTNRCKNITLPQTSFAGGNNCHFQGEGIMVSYFMLGCGRFSYIIYGMVWIHILSRETDDISVFFAHNL